MTDPTSTELLSPQPEIAEEPEDTPRSITEKRRIPMSLIWAFASTPVLQAPALDFSDDILAAKNVTPVMKEVEEFSWLLPVEEDFAEQASRESEAETANRARLALLARQYVAERLSTEEEARLAIVSEKVRRLIPRVTVEDFQELERILEETERIELEDIERRSRLGID